MAAIRYEARGVAREPDGAWRRDELLGLSWMGRWLVSSVRSALLLFQKASPGPAGIRNNPNTGTT